MACASSTFTGVQLKLSLESKLFLTGMNGIVFSRHSFHSRPCSARIELYYGKTAHRNPIVRGQKFCCEWKDFQIPRSLIFTESSPKKQHVHSIKAVVTVEPKCWIPNENEHTCVSNWQFNSSSEAQESSDDDCTEMDERERSRRIKISKANKGNVPWNKGKKHSAETIQRIRERTKIAMQDPKVKMKLVNLGHAQSEETRIKIGVGVREGWQRRREMLMAQESCLQQWQNMIAETSRKGYATEDELQWDSYKIFDEQLKREWVESIEKRKTMPRPKGSKREPKSLEQRRKISEAISAKWADPEYRGRVCSALAKYHGVPVEGEKRPRRKQTTETSSVKKEPVKRKPKGMKADTEYIKKAVPTRKRNAAPSYKDPMANIKLEMIKKIRADRAEMETRKREATERAKLLIAEAEKAAKALEMAAMKSPLARASLLETRKLIAEATRSIESIEKSQMLSQDNGEEFHTTGSLDNHGRTNIELPNIDKDSDNYSTVPEEPRVNGYHIRDDESEYEDFDYDRIVLQNDLHFPGPQSLERNFEGFKLVDGDPSISMATNCACEDSIPEDLQAGESNTNGFIEYKSLPLERGEDDSKTSREGERSATSTVKTKKWVCGRLVEVEGN